ncbi:MAG: phosphoribosylamine--glycine ligase [Candidatus Diapherotrites archaeon]|nr:phosphoribosylamine--glycine ligase [Candidatus Diapherotrites archaeon]
MKVLLVGNGAREHVMGEALAKTAEVYCVMGANNPGLVALAAGHATGKTTNPEFVLKKAKEWGVDYCVVGPEAPLGEGVTDVLEENGILCASPSKAAAQIELDKSFCRELMEKHACRGRAVYKVFDNGDDAAEFIEVYDKPVAVKPLGLTGGKGVKVVADVPGQLKTLEAAKKYAKKVIEDGIGGGARVIIEEKLEGEEFTIQAFVDGEYVVPTPAVQDHKFAYDGDKGPFTGGMGSYSNAGMLLPFMKQEDYDQAVDVLRDVVAALKAENTPYKGVMYGQFMLTGEGPKVVEINARFGDPEAMNVLPVLKTPYCEVCEAINEGELVSIPLEFEPKATVCKYIVPKGYPQKPESGKKVRITGKPKSRMYYASVDKKKDGIHMSSSRALAFVGIGDTIEEAEAVAAKDLSLVKGRVQYRKDIGTPELIQKRIRHMNELREAVRVINRPITK